MRVQWPGPQIAERMGDIWNRATQGVPLRIVAGDPWAAGLVSLSHKDRPRLLSNADIRYSPWISAAQLEADGMLVLVAAREKLDRAGTLYRPALVAGSTCGPVSAPQIDWSPLTSP